MDRQHIEVDIVYLWVDGNDIEWQKKKQAFTGVALAEDSEVNCAGRYVSNDELKYSLRSIEKHAPWIRNIFIVTDNQQPTWLNTDHPRIHVIDHKDILPPEALPSFNSSVIEYFIYRIPGLAEHFIFSNDDMFFNTDLNPGFFFENDGLPIVRLKKKFLGKWNNKFKTVFVKKLGQYAQKVMDGAILVEKKFGKYYSSIPHHNIDAYLKSDYREAVEVVFHEQVQKSLGSRVRTFGDMHRSAFAYYTLAIGRAHLKHVGRRESSRILIHRHNFEKYLNKYNPTLFCLNDSQRVTDENRKLVRPFLERLFPVKSAFEK